MESQEEKETGKTRKSKTAGIVLIVIISLSVIAAVVAFSYNNRDCPDVFDMGTEGYAKTERASVQTALLAGMADNNITSVTAGTVTHNDNNKTVYYPGGNFTLETYLQLPTWGEWHWNTDGMVDKGCYEDVHGCAALSEGRWTCKATRSCSNCTCS